MLPLLMVGIVKVAFSSRILNVARLVSA
jgi:hypothetical protein